MIHAINLLKVVQNVFQVKIKDRRYTISYHWSVSIPPENLSVSIPSENLWFSDVLSGYRKRPVA